MDQSTQIELQADIEELIKLLNQSQRTKVKAILEKNLSELRKELAKVNEKQAPTSTIKVLTIRCNCLNIFLGQGISRGNAAKTATTTFKRSDSSEFVLLGSRIEDGQVCYIVFVDLV
jgi:hypothetical protein